MAFRRKAVFIDSFNADIVVVPECEHPDKLKFTEGTKQPTAKVWFGNNLHKGLGIFSYNNYKLKTLDVYNKDLQIVVPIEATKGRLKFILLAIWANNPNDPDGAYVEQVWKAIHHYDDLLNNKKVILAGDFNSNTIWDRTRRIGNHSAVVDYLKYKGIESAYHLHQNQIQGKELRPTQFMYRHRDKPYHLDYCFASKWFLQRLLSVEIGEYDTWIKHSDHMPVIVAFE